MSPKVSIIITAHNYAKWLPQSLDSALNQSFKDLEVIVVDDGSSDHTPEVLSHYKDVPNLKVIRTEGLGLAKAANTGIRAAKGAYIVRLDADDWFEENLVLVEATYLDNHPNVGMVFCDFYTVDVHGEIIQNIRRNKVNEEVELLDRPCLAAGAMYRRSCWESLGGYNEEIRYQEDYDFWIKFIERFQVRNVSVPMMYYRQHGSSMSRNFHARMRVRRDVKHKFVKKNRDEFSKQVMAVIPARGDLFNGQKLPLLPLGGETLLERAIKKLQKVERLERIVVSTDDPEIAEMAIEAGAEVPYLRSKHLLNSSTSFSEVLGHLLKYLSEEEDYQSDLVVLAHTHAPFFSPEHVSEIIDTLLLYNTSSVVAVVEDLTYHWKIGRSGLTPVGYRKRVVRQEKDLIFKEAGSLYCLTVDRFLKTGDLLGESIGHIEMAIDEALRIQSPFEYWVAKNMVESPNPWNVD